MCYNNYNVKYIVKRGEKDTVAQFLKNTKRWTCFYGIAGAGKTTFVGNIEKYLPKSQLSFCMIVMGEELFYNQISPGIIKKLPYDKYVIC